jgi:TonB family protein
MTSFPRRQPAALAALALVAAGAVMFACSTPAPDSTAPLGDKKATPAVAAGPTLVSADQPFKEFQVEQQVTLAPGASPPRYPDVLRTAKIEGDVLAQFVVDKDGTPMVPTFKVLKSTHPLFTEAVRASLGNLRFTPALVGGRPVRQLLEMPFSFRLTKDQARAKAEMGPARRPQ